ncbi:type II secretion system F family protein [Cellulomonas cellasea]|uniref:Type II secretion system protein GspF domain-containing protein n=2 Tax=Cellulomonas cellasea TaxID=43670 RepID=A0A4Y3KQZ3_9CELL|nr:hypothetical protein [Cellulomonas cellasea]GEA86472.1 hypothetical protein CCE01nite_04210 [Cellulomonas cellasea]
MTAGWAGLVVALAVLAAVGPRGRSATVLGRGGDRVRGGARGRAGVDRAGGALPHRVLLETGELGAAVTGVASALRAGSSPAHAWLTVTGTVVGPHGVPALSDLVPARARLRTNAAHVREQHVRRARAVVAAGRLAAELGTPLGPVLDRVARTLASDEELEGERGAALAGPRSTATVLRWLPVLGVVLGAALGADPLGVLLDGGPGAVSALVGAVLLGAGHVWTRRLVATAQASGDR